MKFSRIDRVNDPLEKRSLLYDGLYKAVYIACFGYDENESIPLWKMYTPKGQGVRVGFFFKGPNIHDNFLDSSRTILDSNNSEVDWISLLSKDQEGTARMMIKDVQYSDRGDDFGSMSIQNGVVDVDGLLLLGNAYEAAGLTDKAAALYEEIYTERLKQTIWLNKSEQLRFKKWLSEDDLKRECQIFCVNRIRNSVFTRLQFSNYTKFETDPS